MAQYPLIRIEILSNPSFGDNLTISIGSYNLTMVATTANPPGFGYFTIGATTQQTTINLFNALSSRYSSPFFFTYSSVPNYILIQCNRYDIGNFTYSFDNASRYNVVITPLVAPVSFDIVGLSYASATGNKCDNVKVTALVVDGVSPYVIRTIFNGAVQQTKNVNSTSDLFFDFPRYTAGERRIEVVSNGTTESINVATIARINSVSTSISYGELDASITVNPIVSSGVSISPYQFSIDDINYQSSNVFQIGVSGDYTAYVVDKYGCKKSVGFTIDIEERKAAPYFDIEITNPLRLVDQNITGIKNISNQLSADYDIPNVEDRFFRQPFKIGDIIRTQFKSNYSDHEVRVYNCGNLIETITPILKIKNTNRSDKRDAVLHTGAPNKTNVSFTQGNIYDPITNDIIDTYFQFDGRLPSFVRVGMLLTFNDPTLTGTFEVEEIIFDETLQSWVAVITATRLGSETAVQVLSTYNLEEYNIYEFELTYPEGQYHIEVVATDDNALFPDVLWESEPFFFSDDIEVVTIDYSSNVNQSLIDYRTDIEFRLCVPGRFAKYQPTTESETFKDDLGNLYLQKNTYNRMWEVETSLIPWWLAEKLMVASKHKILKIDGLSVVNSETPEVTDRLGERNPFYQVVGMYQENIDISVTDETGIISRARGILGGNENQVIGI